MSTSLTRATFAAAIGGVLWLLAPIAASAYVPAAPLTLEAATPALQSSQYRERVGRNPEWRYRYHRHHRHCWRGHYGRLHCRY